jgi:hypothetical protein
MADERGEHHYPRANDTEAERRARRERDELKRRLEHGTRSDLQRGIKRTKP